MHCLKFESSKRMFGLLQPCDPYSASLGRWRVYEVYKPDVHKDVEEGLGAYNVVLETDVGTYEELSHLYAEGVQLCEELEPAWLYVWGMPLHGFRWHRRLVQLMPPNGWSTNHKEVERALQAERSGLTAELAFHSRQWLHGSALPLEHALRIWEKIGALSDDALQALIRFHYEAHSPDTTLRAGVFFLCKGLEIAREMLPGDKSTKKEKALPAHVRDALTQPLHQLFGLMNNHLETRHAVRDKKSLTLHPPLGSGLLPFVQDVDLVLRTVICMKLNEEPPLIMGKDQKIMSKREKPT